MADELWVNETLDQLIATTKSYEERALLVAAKKILVEQLTRIEQLEGQLDGTLWSHTEW